MPIRPPYFVCAFVGTIATTIALSLLVFFGDFSHNDVDTLRQYQMEKFNKAKDDVEIAILGDSSAGNAIDAKLFSKLSGRPTLNLAMVGTFGLSSDYNLVRFLSREAKKLKMIIFLHSLGGWKAGFSNEGYFETLRYSGFPDMSDPLFPSRFSYLGYTINLKATLHGLRAKLFGETSSVTIDEKSDYVVQTGERYSNGAKHLESGRQIPSEINPERVHLYLLLDQLCLKEKLVCVYAHGPLHDTILRNSSGTIEKINSELLQAKTILPMTKVFHFGDAYFGDSEDHIDPSYKEFLTTEYFEEIQKMLSSRGMELATLP